MVNQWKIRTKVQWFIDSEKERVIGNLRSGTIGREHAVGSLSTLYQIAASMKDIETMKTICVVISKVRSAEHFYGLLEPGTGTGTHQ